MTNKSFTDRVCLITGGADGLGFALAQRLVKNGARVCLLDINAKNLARATGELGKLSRAYQLDVCDVKAVRDTVDSIAKEFQRIDALVNCAGITGKTNLKTHEVDPADFDRVMALNVRGTLLTCQAVLPHMVAKNYGRILNVASISGKEGNAGMVAYSTSKAAVVGMTKVMGKEYAETGVTVNALAPAVVRTAMVAALPDEQVKYMTDKIPMKRCGTLDEFAAMAEFIISPENSFTTAFCYDLSGGRATY